MDPFYGWKLFTFHSILHFVNSNFNLFISQIETHLSHGPNLGGDPFLARQLQANVLLVFTNTPLPKYTQNTPKKRPHL